MMISGDTQLPEFVTRREMLPEFMQNFGSKRRFLNPTAEVLDFPLLDLSSDQEQDRSDAYARERSLRARALTLPRRGP